eukprot:SAG31_NODE_1195_length_9445_cov_21.712711_12_plen_110_part_00
MAAQGIIGNYKKVADIIGTPYTAVIWPGPNLPRAPVVIIDIDNTTGCGITAGFAARVCAYTALSESLLDRGGRTGLTRPEIDQSTHPYLNLVHSKSLIQLQCFIGIRYW